MAVDVSRAHETAIDAANADDFLPGTLPCSSREVSVDMLAVALASEVMLTAPPPSIRTSPSMVDRRRGVGLRVADAEQLALGQSGRVGAGRRVDADHVVGLDLGAGVDRDLGLGGLDEHLDRQRDQVLQEAHRRVEEELRLERA